jgi:hypothetical protein
MTTIFSCWWLNFWSPSVLTSKVQWELSKKILHAPFPNSIVGDHWKNMIGSGNYFLKIENQYHYSNILMMIMGFHCGLFGKSICKTLQCSSNFLTCYYQDISSYNSIGACIVWNYIHNNSLSPLHYHRKVVVHIYFCHYSIN